MRDARKSNIFSLWGVLISVAANVAVGGGILYASASNPRAHGAVASETQDPQEEKKDLLQVVIPHVEIVMPARLGQKPPEQALPTISNRPIESDQDIVDPKAATQPKSPPKPREIKRTPPVSAPSVPSFDPHRPPNEVDAEGFEDGSRSGHGVGQGDSYLQHVKAQLDNSMVIPSTITPSTRRGLRGQVQIFIAANGQILKWKWVPNGQSANEAFNQMIAQSLNGFLVGGSLRFRPPPQEHQGRWISLVIDGGQL